MTTRKIESASERCNALLAALQAHADRLSLPWEPIFGPLWDGDESHLTGDDVAQAFVADADHHKGLPTNLPLAELMALTVAVAYCIEGIKSDDERHAWNVTMEASKLEGFLSGYRTGEAGLPLVQAIREQLLPIAAVGRKFTAGRQSGTVGPIRKLILRELKMHRSLKNPELWDLIRNDLPTGWDWIRSGKYGRLEGPGAPSSDTMEYERFCNVCSEERRKLKG